MSKAKAPERWRNAIVRYGEAAPGQLLPHPLNPKSHPSTQTDALAGAISEVGWIAPVIVNEVTQHVIDGHARIGIAISRGEPTVPVAYVNLTEEAERLALATFDPIGNLAAMDNEHLAALLDGLTSADDAVASLLRDLAPLKPKDLHPDDADLTPPAEPITKPGDLWLLGEHRLLCGDATKAEDVARLMAGAKADMLWTDPPYGVDYVGKTADALTLDNDSAAGLPALLHDAFTAATPLLQPGAPFYVAAPAGRQLLNFLQAVPSVGWEFHEGLVWVKDTMVLGHSDYHFRHENVLSGWVRGPGRSGRGNHEGTHWHGDHSQVSVFEVDRPKRSAEHPTMKPTELIAAHVENSSRLGGLVLDLFGGSGSTMIAAEQIGRIAYLMEIDPVYVDVAVRRWEHVTGGQAVKAHA